MKKILILIAVIILLTLTWLKRDMFLGGTTKSIVPTSQTVKNIELIKVPTFYNQRDDKWAKIKIGNTSETLGKVGCLVSSVGMNLSFYDIEMNPKIINEKLIKEEGFTKRGWLVWNKLSLITDEKVKIAFPKLSHENIDDLLLEKTPVLAKILIYGTIPHWVLIVGKKEGEYMMLDPLTKGEPMKLSYYGSHIYSIRVLLGV